MQHNFLMYRSRLCRLYDGLGHIIAKLSAHLGADNRRITVMEAGAYARRRYLVCIGAKTGEMVRNTG
jgi:hypothetical protein